MEGKMPMKIFALVPIDPENKDAWLSSWYKGIAIVRAKDATNARDKISLRTKEAPAANLNTPILPWHLEKHVECREYFGTEYETHGKEEILFLEETPIKITQEKLERIQRNNPKLVLKYNEHLKPILWLLFENKTLPYILIRRTNDQGNRKFNHISFDELIDGIDGVEGIFKEAITRIETGKCFKFQTNNRQFIEIKDCDLQHK